MHNSEEDKRCAPGKKYSDGSCFTLEALIEISKNYNSRNPNYKINLKLEKKNLVKELSKKLSNKCDNQICWLRLDIINEIKNEVINEDVKNYTFRPEGPKKKFEWLNTININEVIDQYHTIDENFLYLGAVPSDFEEIPVLGLNNINFKELEEEDKYKIALVINLDEHYQSGSHWVGLFINLKDLQIYYFDSVGKPPIKKIKIFINKVIKYFYFKKFNKQIKINNLLNKLKNINKNEKYHDVLQNIINHMDVKYNNIQHQFKNSECGVYSINFVTRMIEGETFDNIINNPTSDDTINKFREKYFRNVKIS